ncbi:DUF2249 domain-containing protein [Streptomyces sp. NPDC001276]|uniref:DUF2249 domain-containing protein n=1 Tax=Streptomyces sp. NPDC001276 TaxID=3364555 RepID=UPI0036A87CF3
MVEDISGGEAEEGGGCGGVCGCGGAEKEAVPELDVRSVPHALRHATAFGALDVVSAGRAMVPVAPHDPLPLSALVHAESTTRKSRPTKKNTGGHVMDVVHRRTGALVGMAGAALMAAGPVMVLRGRMGRKEIRTELAAQRITFPDHGLPAHLAALAGQSVETGAQAHAYAELIKDHVAKATGGRTYAEITEELYAAGNDDEKLAELRQTAFMGETLRGSLLSAYQAWHLTTLVMGLGGMLTGIGAALVATADALGADPHRR